MRRTPLRRGGPLRRRTPLKRGKPFPRGNGFQRKAKDPERAAERFERQFGGDEYIEWLRWFPCATCGKDVPCEASHVRSRGAGGTVDDIIPQCPECHRALHSEGRKTFEIRRGLDLRALALSFAEKWASSARRDSGQGPKPVQAVDDA